MDDDMYYYEDGGDEFVDEGYTEQQQYERYMSAVASGRRFIPPQERPPFGEIYTRCLGQLIMEEGDNGMSVFGQLGLLLGLCLLVLFTSTLTFLPRYVVPLTSLLSGVYVLFAYFDADSHFVYLLLAVVTVCYLFMYVIQVVSKKSGVGLRVGVLCIVLVLMIQFLLPEKAFMRLRGVLMILTMKIFSAAWDLQEIDSKRMPNFIDFYSYCLGVNSVMFGPWISYRQHLELMKQKIFESIWKSFFSGLTACILAVGFLLFSSCILEWLIPDDYDYYSYWLIAFRDAMTFRFSHYFVCFTAEAGLHFSGYLATPIETGEQRDEEIFSARDEASGDGRSGRYGHDYTDLGEEYFITKPFSIEFPRSLVDVVVNWNIPMHAWLKKYCFTPMKDDAGYFWAILLTYAVSSILHGFNFQISAVLLSLGLYTYAEHVLREKLAKAFHACIRARRCRRDCDHVYKSWSIYVILVNLSFFLLAVFHLTYLGMVFDTSDLQEEGYSADHTLNKWSRLKFVSHWTALGVLLFAKVI